MTKPNLEERLREKLIPVLEAREFDEARRLRQALDLTVEEIALIIPEIDAVAQRLYNSYLFDYFKDKNNSSYLASRWKNVREETGIPYRIKPGFTFVITDLYERALSPNRSSDGHDLFHDFDLFIELAKTTTIIPNYELIEAAYIQCLNEDKKADFEDRLDKLKALSDISTSNPPVKILQKVFNYALSVYASHPPKNGDLRYDERKAEVNIRWALGALPPKSREEVIQHGYNFVAKKGYAHLLTRAVHLLESIPQFEEASVQQGYLSGLNCLYNQICWLERGDVNDKEKASYQKELVESKQRIIDFQEITGAPISQQTILRLGFRATGQFENNVASKLKKYGINLPEQT